MFSQQMLRSRFTGSRWQRIGSFPQNADLSLSRFSNQFHFPLKSGTFLKKIYTGSPNPSCATKTLAHKLNRKTLGRSLRARA
jgi:hypothetical protein